MAFLTFLISECVIIFFLFINRTILPTPILSQVDELLSTLKDLMPTIYQKETLESIIGLLLDGQGNAVPHHCQTKSESAISRFLNHYNWCGMHCRFPA